MDVVTIINSLGIMDDITFVIKYNLAADELANDDKIFFRNTFFCSNGIYLKSFSRNVLIQQITYTTTIFGIDVLFELK